MSNIFKRILVLFTFFGACISMVLIVASLGTKQWIVAGAKRLRNPLHSDGRISFGLFDGRKELNVAYGWRTYELDVIELIRMEPDFMWYSLWLSTIITLCGGLLFSVLSAIFAAITSTTSNTGDHTNTLYIWNILTFCNSVAICCWLIEYFNKLQFNVLSKEDLQNDWSSDGLADLGYSFWFVVGANITIFLNVLLLCIANTEREIDIIIPVVEEKSNGAIMLY